MKREKEANFVKSITRTNWFSQPGFLGVESSWTMSPASTDGTWQRWRWTITAQNAKIQKIFSKAIEDFMNPLTSHSWN
jgi:hypothetical protein